MIFPAAFLGSVAWGTLALGLVFYLREIYEATGSQIGAFVGLWYFCYILGCLLVRPLTDRIRPRYLLPAASFAAWGAKAFGLLVGDFAFALWDDSRQRLHCVRDPLGMRPLFYHQDHRRLLVASTIGELFREDARLAGRLAEQTVTGYLAGVRPAPEATFFRDVRRLPAGHRLEATREGTVRAVRYWDPRRISLVHHKSADDYADDFRHRFLDSVRGRLRTAAPHIGVHVSGGFDSSAVAAATHFWNERAALGLRPWAFTNIASHPAADERRYMEEVLGRFPMEEVSTLSEDFWAFKPASDHLEEQDEPYEAPYFARYLAELEAARKLGIEVVLSGAGGDEIGGSSFYLVDLLLRGRVFRFWPELGARAAGKHESSIRLLKSLVRALGSWLRQNTVGRPVRVPPWLSPRFARRLRGQHAQGSSSTVYRNPARDHLYQGLEFCRTEPMLSQSHQIARQFGVEYRYPFLDRRLFEWALSVPPFRFGEDGRVKAPLRRALVDMLPSAIVNRRDKSRYNHYFDLGLRDRERPRILDLLEEPISAELGFVEPRPLRKAYESYARGGEINRGQLWSWLTLEQWLRRIHQRA
ncbi:MAG: hypothetical protein HQ582_08420 [Planctomycetes bacterium]|nr:hypothetical protein [Planctomycetota bacterium]